MSHRHLSRRMSALGVALALMPLGLALGQERAGEGRLVLKERRIDVSIDENLAILKYSFSVVNPTSRLQEGQVSFDVPAGATGCGLSLLRNIASTDRAAKVMDPRQAAAVYDAIRKRDLELDDLASVEALPFGPLPQPPIPGGPEASPSPSPGAPTSKLELEKPKKVIHARPPDPALLEWVSGDSYRLRFFPVPAYSDETVEATFAVELRDKGGDFAMTLPVASEARFVKTTATTERLQVRLATRGRIERLASPTDGTPPRSPGRTWELSAPIAGRTRSFQLTYGLDGDAKPYDGREAISEDDIFDPGRSTAVFSGRALQALRVRTLVDAQAAGSANGAGALELAAKAKIVTSRSSLIVIERWEAEETLRKVDVDKDLVKQDVAAAVQCDHLRRVAGLTAIGKGDRCGLRMVETNDAARIADAKRLGWRTWASDVPLFTCFAFVRHHADCPIREENPEALKRLSGLMKD